MMPQMKITDEVCHTYDAKFELRMLSNDNSNAILTEDEVEHFVGWLAQESAACSSQVVDVQGGVVQQPRVYKHI